MSHTLKTPIFFNLEKFEKFVAVRKKLPIDVTLKDYLYNKFTGTWFMWHESFDITSTLTVDFLEK